MGLVLTYGILMAVSMAAMVISGVVTEKFWPGAMCFGLGCALGAVSLAVFHV